MNLASSDPAPCVEIVRECLACGINFFVTAPIYGNQSGCSARRWPGAGQNHPGDQGVGIERSAARASIERSFKRLRTDVIDLLQIHNRAGWREVTPVMQAFQREGRIRYLGSPTGGRRISRTHRRP